MYGGLSNSGSDISYGGYTSSDDDDVFGGNVIHNNSPNQDVLNSPNQDVLDSPKSNNSNNSNFSNPTISPKQVVKKIGGSKENIETTMKNFINDMKEFHL